ncbi:MAG: hypothetical protein FJ398_15365 [Verrucomicrobia bacterium]|nr:hypothetical protein [Verrucomicrobiota bacterium]
MKRPVEFQRVQVAFVVVVSLLLLLAAALEEPVTTVRFRLLAASGQQTPSMVCITSAEDKAHRPQCGPLQKETKRTKNPVAFV